jgi:hypothetical protein
MINLLNFELAQHVKKYHSGTIPLHRVVCQVYFGHIQVLIL